MKTFGKIMCVVLVLALLTGGCFALYKATNSFKDWNPENWGENIKPPEKTGETIIQSQKYGTFVIPKQSMLQTSCILEQSGVLLINNNSDLKYLKNEMYTNYVNFINIQKEQGEPIDEDLLNYLKMIKDEELTIGYYKNMVGEESKLDDISPVTNFNNLYCLNNEKIIFSQKTIDENKNFTSSVYSLSSTYWQLVAFPKNYSDEKYNNYRRELYCIPLMMTSFYMTYENIYDKNMTFSQKVSRIINSDKNILLTEGIYNEIMNDPTTVVTYA